MMKLAVYYHHKNQKISILIYNVKSSFCSDSELKFKKNVKGIEKGPLSFFLLLIFKNANRIWHF